MRFSEKSENVNPDFVPRDYLKPAKQVIPYYLISLVLVIGTLQLQDILGSTTASILAFIMITITAGYLYYRLQEGNDMLMSNDFQTMLFASATSLGSVFCFFIKRDGTVVYANDGTRQMFPNFVKEESRALDSILRDASVSKEDSNKLYSAITRGKKENLVFKIKNKEGESSQFIVIIEPLKRPSGYFVVHGRPYYPNRQGTVKLPGNLARTSPEKIESLLDTVPIGVYLTNETGIIEYTNPAFERILRYETRELATQSPSIQSLIYHADGQETGEFELREFTGNVLMSCKNNVLLKALLEQHSIPGENDKASGYMGLIHVVD